MSDFSTNADEEDIEGVTDWYVDKDYEMVPVEVLEPDQVKKFNELKKINLIICLNIILNHQYLFSFLPMYQTYSMPSILLSNLLKRHQSF